MSEPLSSHEIEDVLSSIRRLVSEDLRPALRQTGPAAPAATPPAGAAPGAGKLVLTQALRVVAAEPAPVTTPAAAEAPVAAPVAAVAPPPPATGEVYDDAGMDERDAAAFFAAGAFSGPEAAEPAEADIEDDPAPAPVAAEDGAAGAGEEGRRGHWTAETMPDVSWMQSDEDWPDEEPVPFAAHPRAGAAAEDPLARAWADRAEAEVRAELQGAGLHGVVPPPRSEPEPPPAPDAAGPTAGTRAEPGPFPGSFPGLFDGDDPAIDEEMLRDIVREIIREELAGTLGERITRNVRKLVRAEINRALTAREFE